MITVLLTIGCTNGRKLLYLRRRAVFIRVFFLLNTTCYTKPKVDKTGIYKSYTIMQFVITVFYILFKIGIPCSCLLMVA